MRTELDQLRQRQRHYEWELARDAQARTAAKLVAGKTHDLSNLVQVVQLATGELQRQCGDEGQEFIDDLMRASHDAHRALVALMTAARPELPIVRGAPIGPAIAAAVERVRELVAVEVELAVAPETATRCTSEDLEHLVIGLALDMLDRAPRIQLQIRERTIEHKPWVEIVRGALPMTEGDVELRVVAAIAAKAGGELATSEHREGGTEVIVALPIVR